MNKRQNIRKGKKPRAKPPGKVKKPGLEFDEDDFDQEYDDYVEDFEVIRIRPINSRRLEARRKIELARENRALMRALEDYPDF